MISVDRGPSDAGEGEGHRGYLHRDTPAGYFFRTDIYVKQTQEGEPYGYVRDGIYFGNISGIPFTEPYLNDEQKSVTEYIP